MNSQRDNELNSPKRKIGDISLSHNDDSTEDDESDGDHSENRNHEFYDVKKMVTSRHDFAPKDDDSDDELDGDEDEEEVEEESDYQDSSRRTETTKTTKDIGGTGQTSTKNKITNTRNIDSDTEDITKATNPAVTALLNRGGTYIWQPPTDNPDESREDVSISIVGMTQSERKKHREKKRRSEITGAIDQLTAILLKTEPAGLIQQHKLIYHNSTTNGSEDEENPHQCSASAGQQPLNRTEIINHASNVLEKLFVENEERKSQLSRFQSAVSDHDLHNPSSTMHNNNMVPPHQQPLMMLQQQNQQPVSFFLKAASTLSPCFLSFS